MSMFTDELVIVDPAAGILLVTVGGVLSVPTANTFTKNDLLSIPPLPSLTVAVTTNLPEYASNGLMVNTLPTTDKTAGALLAAEYIADKKGIFTMKEVLGF